MKSENNTPHLNEGVAPTLIGEREGLDFSLSEEIFSVERPSISYFLLLTLYFPLLLIR
jgi:hypothetical protein